jgi:hypothetical protein
MSLNGLDEVAVIEAYQAALAEPGGWSVASCATGFTTLLIVFLLQVPVEVCHEGQNRCAAKRDWRCGRGQNCDRAI